jgi:hypothetical protein
VCANRDLNPSDFDGTTINFSPLIMGYETARASLPQPGQEGIDFAVS